jgi:hypothetical protein
MTRSFRVHYDGKVLVPEVPIDLPLHEPLVITVDAEQASEEPAHGTYAFLVSSRKGRGISDQDAELMRAAIEDACERIDSEPPVDFDAPADGHKRRD